MSEKKPTHFPGSLLEQAVRKREAGQMQRLSRRAQAALKDAEPGTEGELAHQGRALLDAADDEPAVMHMSLIEAARIRRDESAARRAVQRIQRGDHRHALPLSDSPGGKESEGRGHEAGLGFSAPAQGSTK